VGNPLTGGAGRWLVSGPVIALLLIGAVVVSLWPDAAPIVGFGSLALAIPLIVGLFFRRSVALPDSERQAWRWVAVGLSMFWLGIVVIAIFVEAGVALPAFGPLDGFFLAAYVAMIIALYKLARLDSGGREWVLTLIDAAVGGIALAALIWDAFFADLVANSTGAPWWEVAIAATYPILDVVVVFGLFILIIRRSNYRMDPRLMFFALGGMFQVLADLIYLDNSVGLDFTATEPAFAVNMVAAACMAVAATIVDRGASKREFLEAPTPLWAIVWPYVLAAILVGVHFENYRSLNPPQEQIILLDAVILIGVIILLRQVYVIYRDRNRVDRKRAELVASVSHELRTPLTAMVGFLTLLDDHAEEFPIDTRQEMIGEAADQARHMSRLVSDLLMLARGDSSYMTLERREVRAVSLLVSTLRNIEPSGMRFDEDFDAEVTVLLDPDRMRQALSNLISNAQRYGGDRCLIVARVSGRDLRVEVHDNGVGVPAKYEGVIWEQFERGAHRLDAVTPGLGIGLSIVQAILDAHGGQAEYRKSERLGGACFSLVVPGCVVAGSPARTPVPTF
jgi:signal transduction histidine kinase